MASHLTQCHIKIYKKKNSGLEVQTTGLDVRVNNQHSDGNQQRAVQERGHEAKQ